MTIRAVTGTGQAPMITASWRNGNVSGNHSSWSSSFSTNEFSYNTSRSLLVATATRIQTASNAQGIDGGSYRRGGTTSRDMGTSIASFTTSEGFSNPPLTSTIPRFVSYETTSTTVRGGAGALTFSTLSTSIQSAKVITVSTLTFLSQTTGQTTTSRWGVSNQTTAYTTTTYGTQEVLETITIGHPDIYTSTRYEVFDDGNDYVEIVSVGAGGLPTFQVLEEGAVVGEEGHSYKVGQMLKLASVSSVPTLTTIKSSIGLKTYETFYEDTYADWYIVGDTTSVGYDYTTLETTTEFFGTETTITLDTTTTFAETYPVYSTSIATYGSPQYRTLTETSMVSTYNVTKTVNRVSIGKKHAISAKSYSTWSHIETSEILTTITETSETVSANTVWGTRVKVESYIGTYIETKFSDSGAFVADKMFLFVTTRIGTGLCIRTVPFTDDDHFIPPFIITATQASDEPVTFSDGNYRVTLFTSSGANLIIENAGSNFFLEPVGPPCLGGIHASGSNLEFEDNSPHYFPASLLWQGQHDSIHASPSASSFYQGGVPLISHNITWEWQSRTYNWITADGTTGELQVQGTVNSTSTSSTTFSIGLKGECTYTGAMVTTQAGGKYFSTNQATLVANSPVVVFAQSGTKSFGEGVHTITEAMRFDNRLQGSVLSPGTLAIYKEYRNRNTFLTI